MAASRSAGKWHRPDSAFTIEYSIPLFYEIDALVSEGFRRIPRGGIEHGGLLFGIRNNDSVEIRAFRQVECEHAKGPGFSLSPSDLDGLQEQLDTTDTDQELTQLVPLGLFVSHSRKELRMTNEEATLFRSLFQEAWHLLLLVKPDRFKPTDFAFVFANEEDLAGADLVSRAFALPITNSQERIISSEPEPKPTLVPLSEPALTEIEEETSDPEARIFPVKDIRFAEPPATAKIGGFQTDAAIGSEHHDGKLFIPNTRPTPGSGAPTRMKRRLMAIAGLTLSASLITACCVWFVWNYVEQPVELHVRKVPGGIVVSWPPTETQNTDNASLRIWNGDSAGTLILSPAQKQTGQKTLAITADDVTIELVAHRWMHQRRGMIRVLLTDKGSSTR